MQLDIDVSPSANITSCRHGQTVRETVMYVSALCRLQR